MYSHKYCFNKDSFSIFNENFKLVSTTHSCNTRSARNGLLFVPSYNTVRLVRKSIIHSTNLTWNYLQDKLTEYNFLCLTPKSLKMLLVRFFFSEYNSYIYKLKSNEPVALMIIYYEYEIVYIYLKPTYELSSTCDICNMPIAILINFLLFLSSFSFSSLLKCFIVYFFFFL